MLLILFSIINNTFIFKIINEQYSKCLEILYAYFKL